MLGREYSFTNTDRIALAYHEAASEASATGPSVLAVRGARSGGAQPDPPISLKHCRGGRGAVMSWKGCSILAGMRFRTSAVVEASVADLHFQALCAFRAARCARVFYVEAVEIVLVTLPERLAMGSEALDWGELALNVSGRATLGARCLCSSCKIFEFSEQSKKPFETSGLNM